MKSTVAIDRQRSVERQNTFAEEWRGIQQSRIVYTAESKTAFINIWGRKLLSQSVDDADSINSLLQTTLECLNTEELRVWVVGSQVCDVEHKIETAIEQSVCLCQDTIVATRAAPRVRIVVVPTMARLVCNVALRAFGFGKVSEKQFEEIMREVVWCNTDRLCYKTLGIFAVETTTLALL